MPMAAATAPCAGATLATMPGGGGNQTQGAGMLPNKVSVPLPGTNETQPPYKGGMAKTPQGFNSGEINGMVGGMV